MRYTFLHLKDYSQTLIDSEQVHIFSEMGYIPAIRTSNNTQVYVYCFTEQDIEQCLALGYTPHICFRNIYDETMWENVKEGLEVFWFPQACDIERDATEQGEFLNQKKQAICISLSPIFNPQCVTEGARQWLEKIYQIFRNPLIEKDLDLLHEAYSEENEYRLIDSEGETNAFIILGVIGDEPLIAPYSYEHSLKGILRTRACMGCDFQHMCAKKGIGSILQHRSYKGCICVKLMV